MDACERFMRPISSNELFWENEQGILNAVTSDPLQRLIFRDMIESFWECQGHKIELLSPGSEEWASKIRRKLSAQLDYEEEKCSIILGLEENLFTTFVLQLIRITKKEKVEFSSEDAADFDNQLLDYWELHHKLWGVFAYGWRDSFHWRSAFRHLVEKVYSQLQAKLRETHTNECSTTTLLESESRELLSKSDLARSWKELSMYLLDDCLHFHEKPAVCGHGPTKQDERDVLQRILGSNWKNCRLRLLDQARKCTSWKKSFLSVLECISICLSESDGEEQLSERLLDFTKKCEDLEDDYLQNDFQLDPRTVEIVQVTIAEVMRFQLQALQDGNVAIRVGKYLAFLEVKKNSLPLVFRADSFEIFYLLTSKFCEYQQAGAFFTPDDRSHQPRQFLRIHSLPECETRRQLELRRISAPACAETKVDETNVATVVLPCNVENESVEINSNQDLLLRTKLGPKGKTFRFVDNRDDPAFSGTISVDFPPCSVLAEEKIVFEIVPECIVEAYNQKWVGKKEVKDNKEPDVKLVTPVLNIDRENDAPFLRTVTVTLPFLSSVFNNLDDFKIGTPNKLSITGHSVKLAAIKFSPVAVTTTTGQEVKKILRPLKLDEHSNYSFDELGVYFLSEQLENGHFRLDLRRFSNWQEHRRFRMDESKGLVLIISPQRVKPGDIDTIVEANLRAPVVVSNDWEDDSIKEEENKVIFNFPDPEDPPDAINLRDMILKVTTECQHFQIKLQYTTENLRRLSNVKGLLNIPYHPEYRMKYFLTRRVPNSDRKMMRLLELLGQRWLQFVCSYLDVDINGFYEFLGKDIQETFAPEKLRWLPQNVKLLKSICTHRGFDFPELSQNSGEIIRAILSNFRTGLELEVAKREIRLMLLESGMISRNESFTDNLLKRNCEILAAALMYVPMAKMKAAVRKAFEENLMPIDYRLQVFIYDGVPEGETL